MKKIYAALCAVFALLIVLTTTAFAADLPKPTSNFFVNDFANVISDADEKKMQKQGEALYEKCGAQVVVVTIKSLNGADLESYSLELARSWGIGSEKNDDGVLLLLAVEERKVRIEVGYGLEGALPDSKTGRILDTYGIDSFKKDDFSTGLANVYDSLINEVSIEKGIDPADGYNPVDDDYTLTTKEKLITYGVITLVVLFIVFIGRGRRRRGFVYYGGGFNGHNDGGFSGGGFSGGGFSGGGGSFGGGGSSRGF